MYLKYIFINYSEVIMIKNESNKIRSHLITILYVVIILAICFGTVYLLSGKVYEDGDYKNTGLKTEDGYKLQYNEDTGLVYIVEFKHRAGCVRIPYITDYGVTYSFNVDTQELYI